MRTSNREVVADLVQSSAIPPLSREVALSAADILLESEWLKSRDEVQRQAGMVKALHQRIGRSW